MPCKLIKDSEHLHLIHLIRHVLDDDKTKFSYHKERNILLRRDGHMDAIYTFSGKV